MSDGIKWGEDLERDCYKLRRLEFFGLYASGHHDQNCPLENCAYRDSRKLH
jgi:hypothetical protein